MYKCTDCGQEYEIKPDYCDCGNNVFEQIVSKESEIKEPKGTLSKLDDVSENKPIRDRRYTTQDILSWLIFSVCILLSVLSLIFIGRGNPDNPSNIVENDQKERVTREIPSIESLWVNSNPQVVPEEKEDVTTIFQTIFVKPKEQVSAGVNNAVKNLKKMTSSPSQTPKQNIQSTQTGSMTEEQKAQLVKRLTEPKTTVETKKEPVMDEAKLKRELIIYKTSLRNRIAANIDFTKVIGDGSCAVTFKIDSVGNLVERNFATQSQNKSLNDVVYYAMMQNPAFQPPPTAYKNETLTLSVKMYSGNFEVTLK